MQNDVVKVAEGGSGKKGQGGARGGGRGRVVREDESAKGKEKTGRVGTVGRGRRRREQEKHMEKVEKEEEVNKEEIRSRFFSL